MKSFVIWLIRAYKKTEPTRHTLMQNLHLVPTHCIFTPTCSEYTMEAVQKYGVVKGLWLGIKRLIRCRPGSKGRYDPVPMVLLLCEVSSVFTI